MGKLTFQIQDNPVEAFIALVALLVVGVALSGFAFAAFAFVIPSFRDILYHGATQTPAFLRTMVAFNMVLMFLLPAVYVAGKYRPGKLINVTRVRKFPTISFVILSIIAFVISQPGLNLVGEWNRQLTLPDAFSGLMDWIRSSESNAEVLSRQMLETNSVWGLIANLLVMALLPGFCEEFLFRGVIQSLFYDWFERKHLAVWISAFVFSFIHFQFLGFVPRMFLGAMLGYVVMYSGSLWSSVWIHTLNNALIVLISFMHFKTIFSYPIDKIGTDANAWLGILSIVLTIAIYWLMRNIKLKKMSLDE